MRALILISTLFVGLNGFAEVKVDCSKSAQGLIKITSTEGRLSLQKAAEKSYECLIKDNASVRKAKADAIRSARKEGDSYGSKRQCAKSKEDLQFLVLKSWDSERPGYVNETTSEISSEGTFLVRQPIKCEAIGTGLFSGIVSASSSTLELAENYRFSMDDDNAPTLQTIEIKLLKADNF